MQKFDEFDSFTSRHIGPRPSEIEEMLEAVGADSLDALIDETIPRAIRLERPLDLHPPLTETEVLERARELASQNQVWRSLIGQGYSGTITPPVIQRNILENPGWYTQYTPYQAEIAQGRLEALLNFQTAVSDLTGLPVANASLLDEATAAAEAMSMCYSLKSRRQGERFFVSQRCHQQTIDVVRTRAEAVGIEVEVGDHETVALDDNYFAVLVQYPASDGEVVDYRGLVERAHEAGALVVAACDLLSLLLLESPGAWGADVAVGNSQRFGVPMGFGGPHAAFFATKEDYQRRIPGRIVGVSLDADGNPALRLALQTREQHIRRDKATSNICTAQVLLAVMAGMYAVYHGPEGLYRIAERVHRYTCILAEELDKRGLRPRYQIFFDTLRFDLGADQREAVLLRAREAKINLRLYEDGLGVSLDEVSTTEEVAQLVEIFTGETLEDLDSRAADSSVPQQHRRSGDYLTHAVFHDYRSETELLRYMTRLQNKDLSLTHSMIPLGSCTMKLNGTAEMMPITWPEFASLHPFAPLEQAQGYRQLIGELDELLCEATGFSAFSMQPNAGSQGEYSGLLVIRAYHRSRGEGDRDVCLIPTSAHGTNPASAVMAGLKVVAVRCDDDGNIDPEDLRAKVDKHGQRLAAMMITYPSTHGVFEEAIRELIEIVHQAGGQVYMDGANLNAQLGLTRPADFGADVCHLNLHKTFCIPHGGGGPGVGPIGVRDHLKPFLPGHRHAPVGGDQAIGPVAAAPWGSAGILPISWAYIKLMGTKGMSEATKVAILNANYIAKRLEGHFDVLYKGRNGRVAHECILDLRRFKRNVGIDVNDIAKRLMDYGFHAPTVAWPVIETVMVEPTESESKAELDRFCDAMIAIRGEIAEVERGADPESSPLKNAPHTAAMLCQESWEHPYTRQRAAYPAPWLVDNKFWPPVRRIDNVYGDRHLHCTCPTVEELVEA
ncbi:MAG TPA: aminomethyl-transferring glycine dehydrogenase [Acidobacteriota bacterium]|nr:aminomethyl-transferring glycine dehydrogenase [Acidobacteriota bacterium]